MRTVKRIATVFGVLAGMSFALFILEESLQVCMFASWAGKDLSSQTRQRIVDTYATINFILLVMTYSVGIFIPPMHIAYRSYVLASDRWLEAQVQGYGLNTPSISMAWMNWLGVSILACTTLALGIAVYEKVSTSLAAARLLRAAAATKKQKRGGKG